jgi:ADP-heptose:LPS heptosyltransferase
MRNRISSLRQRVYAWRQRRPLARCCMFTLLALVWPTSFVIEKLLNRFRSAQKPRRILVIQMAGLGDLLMLTPALAALQNQYPNAKIDLVTLHDYVRKAFVGHPRLNRITSLPCYSGKWIMSKFVSRSGARLTLTTMLCYPNLILRHLFSRYDLGLNFALSDFDRNLGNALLFCFNVRRRVGSIALSDNLLTDSIAVDYARTHRTEAYLKFLQPLQPSGAGVSAGNHNYEFPIATNDLAAVKLALRREAVDSSRPLAVIHPGGKIHINSRRWPAEYYAQVCDFLASSEGFEIVLTGDDGDVDVCDQIAERLGTKVKSLAGRLSFNETAALLSLSELCITNDTATLHLAEATRVAHVVSTFGPTSAALLAPQNDRHIVLQSKLPCAPCMGGIIDANTEACWREVKEECLSGITPDQVVSVLEQLYERRPARVASA